MRLRSTNYGGEYVSPFDDDGFMVQCDPRNAVSLCYGVASLFKHRACADGLDTTINELHIFTNSKDSAVFRLLERCATDVLGTEWLNQRTHALSILECSASEREDIIGLTLRIVRIEQERDKEYE